MASFLDQTPNFNPYIQQLPIEAMMAVGMEKQQLYDKGVERIQSQIDQVGGLDIVRDVDRQYLQTKLNDLGSKLKSVAAADFSNNQLVTSVGGMATNIAKDNTVLSSVQATAKYRKESAMMEEARQKGESAIQNEYDFNQQTQRWMSGEEVGQSFGGRYRKYIDVDKKWLEVLKSLHPDLLEQDIPYVINPDGSIDTNQTAVAMTRMSKEGVSAEKIENALRSSLSPDELEQLNINGRYQFRSYQDPQQLAEFSTRRITSEIQKNDKTIEELKGALKLYASDPEKTAQAEQGIKSLQMMNSQLTSRINEEIEFIKNNPEEAKGYIYKNGAIEQFANSYAWEKQKTNLMTSPINEEKWRVREFAHKQRVQSWSETKDRFDIEDKNRNYQLKISEQFGSTGSFSVYGGKSTNVPDQKGALLRDMQSASDSVNDQINTLVSELNTAGDGKVDKTQVLNAVDAYMKGDVQAYDSLIPEDLKSLATSIIETKADLNRKEQFWNNVQKEAAQKIKPITISTSAGNVTFSSDEISKYLAKVRKVESTAVAGNRGTYLQPGYSQIVTPLTEKEKILHNEKGNDMDKLYQNSLEDLMLQRGGGFIPREKPIDVPTGQARNTWEGIATSLLRKAVDGSLSGMAGGYEGLDQDDAEDALNWFNSKDKGDIMYKKLEQGDQTSLVIMKGSQEYVIPMTQAEAQSLPIRDPDAPSPQYRRLIETQAMGNRATNPNGRFEDAYFGKSWMPKVTLNVRADMKHELNNPAKQYITLRLKLPDGNVYNYETSAVDVNQGMGIISNFTDEEIKQLYNRSPKIPQEVKNKIKNL
jgi:hypothetical protein